MAARRKPAGKGSKAKGKSFFDTFSWKNNKTESNTASPVVIRDENPYDFVNTQSFEHTQPIKQHKGLLTPTAVVGKKSNTHNVNTPSSSKAKKSPRYQTEDERQQQKEEEEMRKAIIASLQDKEREDRIRQREMKRVQDNQNKILQQLRESTVKVDKASELSEQKPVEESAVSEDKTQAEVSLSPQPLPSLERKQVCVSVKKLDVSCLSLQRNRPSNSTKTVGNDHNEISVAKSIAHEEDKSVESDDATPPLSREASSEQPPLLVTKFTKESAIKKSLATVSELISSCNFESEVISLPFPVVSSAPTDPSPPPSIVTPNKSLNTPNKALNTPIKSLDTPIIRRTSLSLRNKRKRSNKSEKIIFEQMNSSSILPPENKMKKMEEVIEDEQCADITLVEVTTVDKLVFEQMDSNFTLSPDKRVEQMDSNSTLSPDKRVEQMNSNSTLSPDKRVEQMDSNCTLSPDKRVEELIEDKQCADTAPIEVAVVDEPMSIVTTNNTDPTVLRNITVEPVLTVDIDKHNDSSITTTLPSQNMCTPSTAVLSDCSTTITTQPLSECNSSPAVLRSVKQTNCSTTTSLPLSSCIPSPTPATKKSTISRDHCAFKNPNLLPMYCPAGKSPSEYTPIIIHRLNSYFSQLKAAQGKVLTRLKWGSPVKVGSSKELVFGIGRKTRRSNAVENDVNKALIVLPKRQRILTGNTQLFSISGDFTLDSQEGNEMLSQQSVSSDRSSEKDAVGRAERSISSDRKMSPERTTQYDDVIMLNTQGDITTPLRYQSPEHSLSPPHTSSPTSYASPPPRDSPHDSPPTPHTSTLPHNSPPTPHDSSPNSYHSLNDSPLPRHKSQLISTPQGTPSIEQEATAQKSPRDKESIWFNSCLKNSNPTRKKRSQSKLAVKRRVAKKPKSAAAKLILGFINDKSDSDKVSNTLTESTRSVSPTQENSESAVSCDEETTGESAPTGVIDLTKDTQPLPHSPPHTTPTRLRRRIRELPTCPLCNKQFQQSVIGVHAAQCEGPDSPPIRPGSKGTKPAYQPTLRQLQQKEKEHQQNEVIDSDSDTSCPPVNPSSDNDNPLLDELDSALDDMESHDNHVTMPPPVNVPRVIQTEDGGFKVDESTISNSPIRTFTKISDMSTRDREKYKNQFNRQQPPTKRRRSNAITTVATGDGTWGSGNFVELAHSSRKEKRRGKAGGPKKQWGSRYFRGKKRPKKA